MEGVRINSTVTPALHARAVRIAMEHGRTIGSIVGYGLLLAVQAIERDQSLARRKLKTDARKDRQ
jgi:hypothetical protein